MKKFTRTGILLIPTILFILITCNHKSKKNTELKEYNVALLVSDALRFDAPGCYGGKASTPNINWLAENGVLFERAYSPSPWTLPTAVSMFTGNHADVYPEETENERLIRFFVPLKEQLFGEILRMRNYDVKMHVENPIASNSNNLQGFESFQLNSQLNEDELNYVKEKTGMEIRSKAYENMYGILHYILSAPRNQNFFVLKWFLDPHSYYDPPKEFLENPPFPTEKLPKPLEYYSSFHFYEGGQPIPNRVNGDSLTEIEMDYVKYLYSKEVESIDERVGYVLNALRSNNLIENTLIIFTSDHGEAFKEHGHYGHSMSYYEELLHIPLIISGPEIPKGKRIKTAVSLLGLVPTIMDLMGLELAEDVQGKSFKAAMREKTIKDTTLYFTGTHHTAKYQDALIERNYKVITYYERRETELYNLLLDPKEVYNVAQEKSQTVRKMFKKIERHRQENYKEKIKNMQKLGRSDVMSQKAKEKILEQLKSLGYIQ